MQEQENMAQVFFKRLASRTGAIKRPIDCALAWFGDVQNPVGDSVRSDEPVEG